MPHYRQIVQKKHGVPVVVGTDAHFATKIGKIDLAMEMLNDIGFPEELILNLDENRFYQYLNSRKKT